MEFTNLHKEHKGDNTKTHKENSLISVKSVFSIKLSRLLLCTYWVLCGLKFNRKERKDIAKDAKNIS
jgi:thiamine phosphate synthase YjbQ (UPF0047 family)